MSTGNSEPEQESGCFGCLGCLGILFTILSLFGIIKIDSGFWVDTTSPNVVDLTELENRAKIADGAVQRFHTQLNQGDCEEAYGQSAEIFKSYVSSSDFAILCTGLKGQFGNVESTVRTDQWEQYTQGTSYTATSYDTKFSKSTIQENFVWLVEDNAAQLAGYDTTSEAL